MMKNWIIFLVCAIILFNSTAIGFAATRIPPMKIFGEKERPVSLILGPQLLVIGKDFDRLYLDEKVSKIKLVAWNNDFREELKTFKKYRFQYAMYAGIIFAGLFFVVLNR